MTHEHKIVFSYLGRLCLADYPAYGMVSNYTLFACNQ